MSLLRTAAHVGVSSSVHGRVQRRQRERWAAQDQATAVAAAQAAPAPAFVPVAPAPVAVAPVAPVAPPAVAPATSTLDAIPDIERRIELLKQLADLHTAGVLSPEEFAVQKARVLG